MPVPAPTHQVLNQPAALRNYNPYNCHPALREALQREGGRAFEPQVRDFAETAAAKIGPLGFEANELAPRLRTHDRFGHRIDQVDYHPAYHRIMATGTETGLASLTWTGRPGARVARSAMMYLHNQLEAGSVCPVTMTHADIPDLRVQPDTHAKLLGCVLAARSYSRFYLSLDNHCSKTSMVMQEH